jgi:hypothetical protein
MHQLVQNIVSKLRDPAEIVAKTARKLLMELRKCYPDIFLSKFVNALANKDDMQICTYILDNQLEKAQELIKATQPSKRMQPSATQSES